jgi:hypothetical protein
VSRPSNYDARCQRNKSVFDIVSADTCTFVWNYPEKDLRAVRILSNLLIRSRGRKGRGRGHIKDTITIPYCSHKRQKEPSVSLFSISYAFPVPVTAAIQQHGGLATRNATCVCLENVRFRTSGLFEDAKDGLHYATFASSASGIAACSAGDVRCRAQLRFSVPCWRR